LEPVVLPGLLAVAVRQGVLGRRASTAVAEIPVSRALLGQPVPQDHLDLLVIRESLGRLESPDCRDSQVCRGQLGLEVLLEALGLQVLREALEILG